MTRRAVEPQALRAAIADAPRSWPETEVDETEPTEEAQ